MVTLCVLLCTFQLVNIMIGWIKKQQTVIEETNVISFKQILYGLLHFSDSWSGKG